MTHHDRIEACYLAPARGRQVFVVSKTGEYDFTLGELIATLEQELDGRGWSSDVLQVPLADEKDLSGFAASLIPKRRYDYMPKPKPHQAKDDHNRAFLDSISTQDQFSDWAAVVAFYVAVHATALI